MKPQRIFLLSFLLCVVLTSHAWSWTVNSVDPTLPSLIDWSNSEHGTVGGLSLAAVRTGDCYFSGVVDDKSASYSKLYDLANKRSAFGKQYDDWAVMMEFWKTGISTLMDEIISGVAANRLYDEDGLKYAGLDAVLRRTEGEAWLEKHSDLNRNRNDG